MLDLKKILRKGDRALRSLIGMPLTKYKALCLAFELELSKIATEEDKVRVRKLGGGRRHTLETTSQKLLFILFYLKTYPTYDLAGVLFDVDASQAYRWVSIYLPILENTLGSKQLLPLRKVSSIADFVLNFPDVRKVCVDGTEIPIQRPKNKEKQSENYSGKKKRHTRKHTTVSSDRRILILTKGVAGKKHDKKDADENDIFTSIPDYVVKEVDLGYIGAEKSAANVKIPYKKPKGGSLTDEQKQYNRQLASSRVQGEHAHSGMKRYNVIKNVNRNKSQTEQDRFALVCAGLWNFYLAAM